MENKNTTEMSWLEIAIELRSRSHAEQDETMRRIYRTQMRGAALNHRWTR